LKYKKRKHAHTKIKITKPKITEYVHECVSANALWRERGREGKRETERQRQRQTERDREREREGGSICGGRMYL